MNRLPGAFWAHVDATAGVTGCWPWIGNLHESGYGRLRIEGELRYAHRIALELHLGRPIGPGLQACHHCDNPPCCNPLHLFEGAALDNRRDAIAKGRSIPAALSTEDVAAIRASEWRPKALACRYGVSTRTIYRALRDDYSKRKDVAA